MLNSMKFRRSSGFSLIELMLAMLIGLIIMGGVMQMYVSTRDTQRSSDDQLTLLADARFAMETIAYDLRHASIWGRHNTPGLIACQKENLEALECPDGFDMPLATADCEDYEYINIARPLFAVNDDNPYGATCASESYKLGTDMLTVRYADTNKIATSQLAKDVVYMRSSLTGGMVFVATGPTLPDVNLPKWDDDLAASNHLLISRVYYVSDYSDVLGDGLPSLRRADLAVGPSMESEVLLTGVEDFQLEFGVDLTEDAQVNSYVNASRIDINLGVLDDLEWNNGDVIAVRVWLLMRSERQDRDNIGSAQTFYMAGKNITTPNDGYRRHLVSGVVKLRNTFQLDTAKAGG